MSIRLKLSLSFLLLFLLMLSLLLLSFSGFYRSDYRSDLAKEQQGYEALVSSIAKEASVQPDESGITSLLSGNVKKGIQFILYDPKGNVLFAMGDAPNGVSLSAKDYVIINGRIEYCIRVNGVFHARELILRGYAAQNLWLFILLTVSLFAIIALFLHVSIVRPIWTLNKRMQESPLRIPLTNKKYRKDEIGELGKHYDEMLRRLQAADRQQQTMLAAVSHDLKTPLTSILTYSERLSSGKVTNETKQAHYLDVIRQKALIISDLIGKFQDAAQVSELRETADFETVSAVELWNSLFEPYLQTWEDVDARLEFKNELETSTKIHADRKSLHRVVENILGNAQKYGSHPLTVYIHIYRYDNQMILKIENNGRQVPDEQLALLFDRFYRVEPSRSQEQGGSGLGLFICREIIEQHGGTICAYKPWNHDFGIEIRLPIAKS